MSSYSDPFRGLERAFERMSEQFRRAASDWDSTGGREGMGCGTMPVDVSIATTRTS